MFLRTINTTLLLLLPALAFAQHFYLKGEVRDEAGNLLPNVSILHHGSGYLFHTGMSGGFGIGTDRNCDTLTFSLTNYEEQTAVVCAGSFNSVRLKRDLRPAGSPYKLSSLTENLRREVQQQWMAGDETYASLVENQLINTSDNPSTGVTLNVDRASYSNIRRFLHMNSVVPTDAVRIEEMLNYFNFNYSPPAANKVFEMGSLLTQCPWNAKNQLLFVNIRSRKVALDSLPPTHLVFLIDVSASMDMPNRLPLLKTAFRGLVNNLRAKDSVSIVVYGGTVSVWLPTTGGAEKDKIFQAIDNLTPGGTTPGESGIKLAYGLARNHFIKKGNNRVILATDGDFNVGLSKEKDLEDLITRESTNGIYLTCLGVGMGNYKDSKIQALAQKGNGNFAYLDSYAEAEKVLMKEFMQTLYSVADDAFLHVQFNPAFVKKYRLIGFDNKMGAIKDTLSVIEGGVIGSAYSLLVAFELLPADEELPESAQVQQPVTYSLRYRLPGTARIQEETQTPRLNLTPFRQLPQPYQFASAVVMFGQLLRDSRFVKNISWSDVLALATKAADARQPLEKEFVGLVQQAKSIYGKRRR